MQHRSRALASIAATALVVSALVAAALMAASPPASAAARIVTQPETITFAHAETEYVTAGSTTPLPLSDTAVAVSTLEVDAPSNATLTFLEVGLDLTHARMDDLDIALVTPSGQALMLLSDVGGDEAFDGALRFDRSTPGSSLSDDAMCGFASGTCTNVGAADFDTADDSDALPVGVPPSPPADVAALGGSSAPGTWTLYVGDDTAGNDGTLRGWSLEIYFALPADPSPSRLVVGGNAGAVTDVDLSLHDVDATSLAESELVLESPDGRRAHVLSDVADAPVSGLELTLDDEAPSAVPAFTTPASGSYRPYDYDDDDTYEWVGGFNTDQLDSRLSTFDGAEASGTWKLYVQQEYCCVSGAIGGWSLRITTADPPTTAPPAADTTAPTVVKTTPKRRAKKVRTSATVKVRFSEDMRASSLTKRTVRLTTTSGVKVRSTFRYRPGRHLLVIDPKRRLGPSTTYQLTVSTRARDLAGNRLANPEKIRFRTR